MAVENFTTYTEVDTGGYLSETTTRATWDGLTRNVTSYLYYDFGVDYFNGDFEFLFDVNITDRGSGDNGFVCWIGLANDLGTYKDLVAADKDELVCFSYATSNPLGILECDGGNEYSAGCGSAAAGTTWYMKLKRDESVGTYGTLYLYRYSDSARTSLQGTATLTLHSSKKDFRYLYAVQSFDDGDANYQDGYIENLDLQETVPTNMKINIGDSLKEVSGIKINVGDSLKTVSHVKINVGDTLKTIF